METAHPRAHLSCLRHTAAITGLLLVHIPFAQVSVSCTLLPIPHWQRGFPDTPPLCSPLLPEMQVFELHPKSQGPSLLPRDSSCREAALGTGGLSCLNPPEAAVGDDSQDSSFKVRVLLQVPQGAVGPQGTGYLRCSLFADGILPETRKKNRSQGMFPSRGRTRRAQSTLISRPILSFRANRTNQLTGTGSWGSMGD